MRRAVAVGAAVAVLVAGACAAGERPGKHVAAGPAASPRPPGWSAVATLDLDGTSPVVARVGQHEVMFHGGLAASGGLRFSARGVVVDVRDGTTRPVPAPPLPAPLGFAAHVDAGETTVAVGKLCSRFDETLNRCVPDGRVAVAYDERANTWRRVDLPPDVADQVMEVDPAGLGRTGPGLAVFGLGRLPELWTYDPGADRWAQLDAPPVAARRGCTEGDRTYVLDHDEVESGPAAAPGVPDPGPPVAASFDHGTGTWSTLPPVPMASGLVMDLVCGGGHVFVLDRATPLVVAAFDVASGTWAVVSPPDERSGAQAENVVWDGDSLLVWSASQATGLAYRPGDGSWRPFPSGPTARAAVVLGPGELLVMGPATDLEQAELYRHLSPGPGTTGEEAPFTGPRITRRPPT